MSGLPATSYAVLGLLTMREEASGYELKQIADRTLRFFYLAPAMSHVYIELDRLTTAGLVTSRVVPGGGRRRTRLFRLTEQGAAELRRWLTEEPVEFPLLKHGVALRVFLGHLVAPERIRQVLDEYIENLHQRIAELEAIRTLLGDNPDRRYPALVAEWGQRYYREEIEVVADLSHRLDEPASALKARAGRPRPAKPPD